MNTKKQLILSCCKVKINDQTTRCICKPTSIINSFVRNYRSQLHKLQQIVYMKQKITYNDIFLFSNITTKKSKNDINNKIRESIIGVILNNKVPNEYYDISPKWNLIKTELHNYIKQVLEKNEYTKPIEQTRCIHRGGRKYHYDFTILVNNMYELNIEFKNNATKIADIPQFVSPMKPSQYLSSSYEEYYYDNYLVEYLSKHEIDIPDRTTYLKTIHTNKPQCVKHLQEKYYRGCKSSSKFSNNPEDIKFYQDLKELSEKSIREFIEKEELDIRKLSDYLTDTQENKIYMLYKNNKFYYENVNLEHYNIIDYKKTKNTFIAITNTGIELKILLRWKNGNGIAYPAFQIS